ncbi:PA14 domain-containing protein [Roseateles sp. LYH14W]|uniref:PA14 domain-containing protein n=1 Tax=Pelomonas parva TaxID=3299032 RepID=A0ABW7F8S4_9BURK
MNPPSHDPTPPAAEPGQRPQWQRGHNGYALTIAVIIHIALLLAVLSWRSQVPPPNKPRSSQINIVEVKQPPKPPEPPPPAPKLPDLPPPNMPPVPELPPIEETKVEPVPQAVAPVVAVAPAPAPAAAPVIAPPPPAPPPVASSPVPPKLFEECGDSPDRKMIAEVFRLRPSFTTVKDIRRLKPIKTVCLAQLNVSPRKFTDGFPGLDVSEWFALDIRFTVNIPGDITMDLLLLSDDGAILNVDDEEVINNDGIHAPNPVMATVKLTKGLRNFRVRYFQGPGPDLALALVWKKPGAPDADYRYIPQRLLGRPPAAASAPG